MTPASWPCPLPGGGTCEEAALQFDAGRAVRLLIVPALFDEGNRMRRFTVELMRRLDRAGIDSFLPDLPGCTESLQPLEAQDPTDWLDAMAAAARHFGAGHALGIRGGCLFTPYRLPALHYAPAKASSILRQMVRARMLSAREAGRQESREELAQQALEHGITLAGYTLGADFYRHFEPMTAHPDAELIAQEQVGGSGLWLRAEPGENAAQAEALAAIIASELVR
jgi:hypothetical protein